jgi:hypothetical protein
MSLVFDSVETLQEVVSLSSDLRFEPLVPQLRASQQFVARFTGEALMERITTKLEARESLDALEKMLLEKMRVPIANLALLRYANARNVDVTDLGVHRTQTANSGDAFEWQMNLMAAQLEADAWEGLEELHRFLEAKQDHFEEYTESDAFQIDQRSLIRSAGSFNYYYFINQSRLTFYALQPTLRKVQDKRIRPLLGDQLALLARNVNLTEEQEIVRDLACTALVHGTIARAMRERVVDVGVKGVQVTAVASFASINYQKAADAKTISATIDFHESECNDAISALTKLTNPRPVGYSGSGVRGGAITSF